MITRNHPFEAARGIFMLLGILLHGASWMKYKVASNPTEDAVFSAVVGFIASFRMPAFFLIAGYFLSISMQKYAACEVFKKRAMRLLLPAISTWVLVNHLGVLIDTKGSLYVAGFDHLWFIVVLFGISTVAVLVPNTAYDKMAAIAERLSTWKLFEASVVLIVLCKAMFIATTIAYSEFLGLTLDKIGIHLPYVIIGILMHRSTDVKSRFLSIHWAVAVFTIPVIHLLKPHLSDGDDPILANVVYGFHTVLTLITVFAVLSFFIRFFDRDSPSVRFLSDASYTVFLFHMLLVRLITEALGVFQLNVYFQFCLGAVITFAVCTAIHVYIVDRFKLPRLLFTGK